MSGTGNDEKGQVGNDMAVDDSVYERLGEFHDVFMVEPWERLRPHVVTAFAQLPETAVIAELGAGTGMGVRVVAQETQARVTAMEPSLVMRSVLTARVAENPDLAARVTVVAGSVPADLGLLPTTISGFVCAHMLGHLDANARRRLFEWIDEHLTEDGVGLVTTQERHDADLAEGESQSTFTQSRTLGDYEYRATYEESAGANEFSTRYEVWNGQDKVREAAFAGAWEVLTVDDITTEMAGLRLIVAPLDAGVALICRP